MPVYNLDDGSFYNVLKACWIVLNWWCIIIFLSSTLY